MAGGEEVSRRARSACRAMCLALCCTWLLCSPAGLLAGDAPLHGIAEQPARTPGQIALPNRSLGSVPRTVPPVAARSGQDAEKEWTRPQDASAKVHLFGTIEFRSKLKDAPQWERVIAEERKKSGLNAPVGLAASWPATRDALQGQALPEQLNGVNRFFNRYPYRLDAEVYKVQDYWASSAEFMKHSGDCEDYAIIKFFALKQLGIDPNCMRIVVLVDTIRNLAHAVVAVYHGGEAYILDNLSNLVLSHTRLTHYKPQFSVNETHRWVHMAPKK